MIAQLTHHLVMWCVLLLLIWAAVSDLTRFVIPNGVSIALVALFPAQALTLGLGVELLYCVLIGLAALAIGVGMFAARVMGGGDVKLLAVMSLWAGPTLIFPFLVITTLAGGVLALLLMTPFRHYLPAVSAAGAPLRGQGRRQPMPYGLAIAAGGVFVALRLAGG